MAKKTNTPSKASSTKVPYKATPKPKGGAQFLPKGIPAAKTPVSKKPELPKNQRATSDSTSYFQKKAYEAGLRYQLAPSLPEMKVQEAAQKRANQDAARQKNKGKSGYDSNGYPLKRK